MPRINIPGGNFKMTIIKTYKKINKQQKVKKRIFLYVLPRNFKINLF